MQQQDNYTLANFLGQKNEDGLYKANACFIREIFDVIPAVDAVPIVDNKKFAESNYVDPNVFLEMGVAFCFNKPIYLLSDLPTTSSLIEEPKELEPICLRGDLEKIIL